MTSYPVFTDRGTRLIPN